MIASRQRSRVKPNRMDYKKKGPGCGSASQALGD
jgi:hypothetical protein